METINHLKQVLWHNVSYVVTDAALWCWVVFNHVTGLRISPNEIITQITPAMHLLSVLLAMAASALTIIKILKELKK